MKKYILILSVLIISGCSTVTSKSEATPDGTSKSEYHSSKIDENSETAELAGVGLVSVGIIAGLALIAVAMEKSLENKTVKYKNASKK